MATPSKTKSCFEQLLSEIYPRRPHQDNQKVCIYCFKPRSNKNKLWLHDFYVLDYPNSWFEILSVCNL